MTNQTEYLETVAPSSEEMQRIAGYRKNNLWKDLQKHLTYQLQETIEQVTAFNQRHEEDFRDASGDIRVLLDAQKASVTYSLDEDYNEIVTKLFTRLDDTKEGAERTQQKYADLGVATYIVFDERTGQYINRVLETVDGTDGEHYPKDKWLKSYKYQTPVFEMVGLIEDREDAPKISVVKNAGTTMFIGSEEELIEHAFGLIEASVANTDFTDLVKTTRTLNLLAHYTNKMANVTKTTLPNYPSNNRITYIDVSDVDLPDAVQKLKEIVEQGFKENKLTSISPEQFESLTCKIASEIQVLANQQPSIVGEHVAPAGE